jgi:hypothetical protein
MSTSIGDSGLNGAGLSLKDNTTRFPVLILNNVHQSPSLRQTYSLSGVYPCKSTSFDFEYFLFDNRYINIILKSDLYHGNTNQNSYELYSYLYDSKKRKIIDIKKETSKSCQA